MLLHEYANRWLGQDAVVRAATAHEGKKKANAKAKEKSDQAEGQ